MAVKFPRKTDAPAHNSAADLALKIAFLRDPAAYSNDVEDLTDVEVIETHWSWVFLTSQYVYKLKKPVKQLCLDLSSLRAREQNCWTELHLNRRLAPHVYLNVVALKRAKNHQLTLGGHGEIIDWLVKMRRLPAERMLDKLVQNHQLSDLELCRLAATLAAFHGEKCARFASAADTYPQRLIRYLGEHHQQLLDPNLDLPASLITTMAKALTAYVRNHSSLLSERVRQGRVLEGHGDLRPEHLCLGEEIAAFDCLEFSQELRTLDTADEIAFLALEIEYLGGREAAEILLTEYRRHAHDQAPPSLYQFYMASRALLRTKLSILHLYDCVPSLRAKWRSQAQRPGHRQSPRPPETPSGRPGPASPTAPAPPARTQYRWPSAHPSHGRRAHPGSTP